MEGTTIWNWSRISEDGPEFFKIFIPSFSSREMWIPPAFARKFIIPKIGLENADLKDESGKNWHVSLEKVGNKLCFTTSWKSFVDDHSLERGDFLLFKYIGKYAFVFKIFGKNGCKKAMASSQRITEEKSGLSPKGSHDDQNKTREANTSSSPNVKAKKDSKPLHFVKNITNSWSGQHVVWFPRPVSKKIKFEPATTLRYRNKLWPVNISFKKDGRSVITGGWLSFVKGNNLKVNDKCVFELALDQNRKICKQMKVVQVIHGNKRG